MSTNKKKRKMAASSNEEKEPEVIEQENVENVEEEMNATAYETFDEGNEPENIEFYDVIEKLEKVPVMKQPPVEEKKKIVFSWSELHSIVPEDFKGLALWGIAALACAISTILTIQFVSDVRGDAGWITLGLGLMWELAKYTFGSIAILHPKQKMRMVLGWTTAILIFGSIAASLGYLTEMNEFVETNKMVDSVEYQDLENERNILKTQMDTLLMSAAEDTKRSYRRRGLETNKKIEDLRERYIDLGEDMVKLREVKVQLNSFDAIASLIISLMLEICGILAISLFAQNKEKSFLKS